MEIAVTPGNHNLKAAAAQSSRCVVQLLSSVFVQRALFSLQKLTRNSLTMADMKSDKTKVDLGLLEEDDEFEEFPTEDWTAKDEDNEDTSVWEDNWDDDDVEDDFNQQLRAQLEKQKAQGKAGSKEN